MTAAAAATAVAVTAVAVTFPWLGMVLRLHPLARAARAAEVHAPVVPQDDIREY
jgi:hypothetical protein